MRSGFRFFQGFKVDLQPFDDPGPELLDNDIACCSSLQKTAYPSGAFRFSFMLFLLRLMSRKKAEFSLMIGGPSG